MAHYDMDEGWDNPREESKRTGYNFARVPARGRLEVICVSHQPVVYRGHWSRGMMVPCGRDECRIDHERVGTQKRWVIGVVVVAEHVRKPGPHVSLLEVGAGPAEAWLDAAEGLAEGGEPSLRGVGMALWRESGVKTGKITCKVTVRTRFRSEDLPVVPDLQVVLQRIWDNQAGGG